MGLCSNWVMADLSSLDCHANGDVFCANSLTADGTNAAAREAIQFAADMIHKYKVHPLWGESNTGPKCQNLFLSEQAAMFFSASNAIGTL